MLQAKWSCFKHFYRPHVATWVWCISTFFCLAWFCIFATNFCHGPLVYGPVWKLLFYCNLINWLLKFWSLKIIDESPSPTVLVLFSSWYGFMCSLTDSYFWPSLVSKWSPSIQRFVGMSKNGTKILAFT